LTQAPPAGAPGSGSALAQAPDSVSG
jgi:hypothetical protein